MHLVSEDHCVLMILFMFIFVLLNMCSVVDRDTAWSRLQGMSNFGSGNSKANSLYWAATRSPPVPGFNSSNTESTVSKSKSTSCQANSACDALGMLGECCPSDSGVRLQCCPMVIDSQ